jgi:hypothetical protein
MATGPTADAAESDTPSAREGRARYFAENGFGEDGGYDARWVSLKAGPLRFGFPNTASRVRAVRVHDLHHVLTGYRTDWTGEAEIGAWELASGCRDFVAAWVLNAYAMMIGVAVAPRRVWRAFLRGRQTRNLYGTPIDDALLDTPIAGLRRRLGLAAAPRPARRRDRALFATAVAGGLVLDVATALLLWSPLLLLLRLLA